jgi:hypothetical protein
MKFSFENQGVLLLVGLFMEGSPNTLGFGDDSCLYELSRDALLDRPRFRNFFVHLTDFIKRHSLSPHDCSGNNTNVKERILRSGLGNLVYLTTSTIFPRT